MKLIYTLLLFAGAFFCSAQDIDSTTCFWFSDDANIDSIYYRKTYYGSGKLFEKGWVIKVTKSNGYKTFDPSTNFDCFSSVRISVGDHFFYYRNGVIETILSYPKSLKDTAEMTVYNKKGDKIAKDKFLERPVIVVDCRPRKRYGIKQYDYYHFTNYSNGELRSEGYYKDNYAKTGCWKKFNKNGELKKTRLYKDDKLVKKSCH